MKNMKPITLPGEDWLVGRSWDLPFELNPLLSYVGTEGYMATPAQMEQFLKSPVAKPMPKETRKEVEEWIAAERAEKPVGSRTGGKRQRKGSDAK
jgi:hypothetical protein